MTKYKVYISIDGKKSWVTVENGKVNWNPTRDELARAKHASYTDINICSICREEYEKDGVELTDRSILYPRNACRNIDKSGKRIEKWICGKHAGRNYEKYDSNSQNNLIKSMRDRRTGNLRDSGNILGDNCEELTSRWLGAERLSVEYDKYSRLPLDHSPVPDGVVVEIGGKSVDLSGKIVQTKGKSYDSVRRNWRQTWTNEHDKEFDILIFYCISKDGKTIERIYFIPKEEVEDRGSICITGYDLLGRLFESGLYGKYRITNEEIIRKVNEIWNEIIKGDNNYEPER